MNVAPIENVLEYSPLAQARLTPSIQRYLQDGDDGDNQQALAAVRLLPRHLHDVRGGHTRLTLFNQTFDHPIMLAPVAYQRLFHAEGETASAMAAAAQGGQWLISSLASQPFAAIANVRKGENGYGPWFQLYWQVDRPRTLRLLQRAIDAGCSAVLLTVDAPIKLVTLQLPDDVRAVNLEPRAALPLAPGSSMVFDGFMAQAPTWNDLEWLRLQTKLPLLIKGILHPDDAERALNAGCDGVVVSNHGGRVIRGTPASLDALMHIVHRIGDRIPILFDGGIRCGRDVFVALAHGAKAVLIGRPYIWGLAANGAMGVAHVIRLMRDDLEMTMALTGSKHLKDIDRSRLADSTGLPQTYP